MSLIDDHFYSIRSVVLSLKKNFKFINDYKEVSKSKTSTIKEIVYSFFARYFLKLDDILNFYLMIHCKL